MQNVKPEGTTQFEAKESDFPKLTGNIEQKHKQRKVNKQNKKIKVSPVSIHNHKETGKKFNQIITNKKTNKKCEDPCELITDNENQLEANCNQNKQQNPQQHIELDLNQTDFLSSNISKSQNSNEQNQIEMIPEDNPKIQQEELKFIATNSSYLENANNVHSMTIKTGLIGQLCGISERFLNLKYNLLSAIASSSNILEPDLNIFSKKLRNMKETFNKLDKQLTTIKGNAEEEKTRLIDLYSKHPKKIWSKNAYKQYGKETIEKIDKTTQQKRIALDYSVNKIEQGITWSLHRKKECQANLIDLEERFKIFKSLEKELVSNQKVTEKEIIYIYNQKKEDELQSKEDSIKLYDHLVELLLQTQCLKEAVKIENNTLGQLKEKDGQLPLGKYDHYLKEYTKLLSQVQNIQKQVVLMKDSLEKTYHNNEKGGCDREEMKELEVNAVNIHQKSKQMEVNWQEKNEMLKEMIRKSSSTRKMFINFTNEYIKAQIVDLHINYLFVMKNLAEYKGFNPAYYNVFKTIAYETQKVSKLKPPVFTFKKVEEVNSNEPIINENSNEEETQIQDKQEN